MNTTRHELKTNFDRAKGRQADAVPGCQVPGNSWISRSKFILLFLINVCLFLQSSAQGNGPSVLFIGNSFTFGHNMPALFDSLACSMGVKCEVSSYTKGGQSVSGHRKDTSCIKAIRSRQWDYIVIQDLQSLYTDSVGKLPPGLIEDNIRFQDSIKSILPNTRIIYFVGWEMRGGRRDFYPNDRTEAMIQRIMQNYAILNNNSRVKNVLAPVGAAWAKCLKERPDLNPYLYDDRHPSFIGAYLTAAMFISVILNRSPEAAKFSYLVHRKSASYLRLLAWQTFQDLKPYSNSRP